MIAVVYFAFTTLATVGYGDYHPVSNAERLLGAFVILFGVAVFSFIMGNFIDMLLEFKIVTADNEDNVNLSKWFGLLARFNKGRPLPKDMTFKIEEYFDHYWAHDKNYAVKSPEDKRFL
jgi:potassium voltage-gated channel Eag-related subfamily H protein 8